MKDEQWSKFNQGLAKKKLAATQKFNLVRQKIIFVHYTQLKMYIS